jgi:hypothetical protein
VARTTICCVPVAVVGTLTSNLTALATLAAVWTPSMTNEPPCSTVVQPVGGVSTARLTRALEVVLTLRSKLTLEPGATATAG